MEVAARIEHELPEHVGWHQIRRELHPFHVEIESLAKGLHHQGLGHAGHPFEQDMAPNQERSDQPGHDTILTHHHF